MGVFRGDLRHETILQDLLHKKGRLLNKVIGEGDMNGPI
jgi:hypothetical protein